jgi:hypothetical protein
MRSSIMHWVQVRNQIQCEWHPSSCQWTSNPHYDQAYWLHIQQKPNPCMHASFFIYKYFLFVYKESSKSKIIKICISCPKFSSPLSFEIIGSSQNILKWGYFFPTSTLRLLTYEWLIQQTKRGSNGLKHTQH